MFLVRWLLLLNAFGCAVFLFERHVREPFTLAVARGLILLSRYSLSNEFVSCNSQFVNKRERKGQKNKQKKRGGRSKIRKLGKKNEVRFCLVHTLHGPDEPCGALYIAMPYFLCCRHLLCTWLAVLIFRNHFSVPSDHNGSGGLPVGLLVAVQACADDKLSVGLNVLIPCTSVGVSHGPCG